MAILLLCKICKSYTTMLDDRVQGTRQIAHYYPSKKIYKILQGRINLQNSTHFLSRFLENARPGSELTVSEGFSVKRLEYTFSAFCHDPLASYHIPSRRPAKFNATRSSVSITPQPKQHDSDRGTTTTQKLNKRKRTNSHTVGKFGIQSINAFLYPIQTLHISEYLVPHTRTSWTCEHAL